MTDLQNQCLLSALGYYPHREIDGIWGPKSRAAMERFEAAHPGLTLVEALAVQSPEPEDFWQTVPCFEREEFRCHCGGAHCDGFPAEPDRVLVQLLSDIRRDLDTPMVVSSGVRCQVHNANVGGVSNSRHLSGKAADVMALGISGATLLRRAQSDPRTRYAYIIDKGPYVHIDVN